MPYNSARKEDNLHFAMDRRGTSRVDTVPRRRQPRIYGPCKAIVRGVDVSGQTFTETTVLDNVSSGGLYLKMSRELPLGTALFVVFAFSTIAIKGVPAPTVAVRGVVHRVEPKPGSVCGVAATFRQSRFLRG